MKLIISRCLELEVAEKEHLLKVFPWSSVPQHFVLKPHFADGSYELIMFLSVQAQQLRLEIEQAEAQYKSLLNEYISATPVRTRMR